MEVAVRCRCGCWDFQQLMETESEGRLSTSTLRRPDNFQPLNLSTWNFLCLVVEISYKAVILGLHFSNPRVWVRHAKALAVQGLGSPSSLEHWRLSLLSLVFSRSFDSSLLHIFTVLILIIQQIFTENLLCGSYSLSDGKLFMNKVEKHPDSMITWVCVKTSHANKKWLDTIGLN